MSYIPNKAQAMLVTTSISVSPAFLNNAKLFFVTGQRSACPSCPGSFVVACYCDFGVSCDVMLCNFGTKVADGAYDAVVHVMLAPFNVEAHA